MSQELARAALRFARVSQKPKGCGEHHKTGQEPFCAALRFARVPQEGTRETALWHDSEYMFFRREKLHEPTFTERIDGLRKLGFSTSPAGSGKAQIIRDGIGALIEDRPGQHPRVNKAGLVLGDEIGLLMNRGFQMFWKSPTGRTAPALATQLKALHAFEEDLKEGLGLPSLYNESLGTTSDLHMYDRVQHRDQGDADKPWEHKAVTS